MTFTQTHMMMVPDDEDITANYQIKLALNLNFHLLEFNENSSAKRENLIKKQTQTMLSFIKLPPKLNLMKLCV